MGWSFAESQDPKEYQSIHSAYYEQSAHVEARCKIGNIKGLPVKDISWWGLVSGGWLTDLDNIAPCYGALTPRNQRARNTAVTGPVG
jgi:hypothetical protein